MDQTQVTRLYSETRYPDRISCTNVSTRDLEPDVLDPTVTPDDPTRTWDPRRLGHRCLRTDLALRPDHDSVRISAPVTPVRFWTLVPTTELQTSVLLIGPRIPTPLVEPRTKHPRLDVGLKHLNRIVTSHRFRTPTS